MNIALAPNATLDPTPTWTRFDDTDNLVASYSIDVGRQTELDRTDGGRATVAISDVDGILDPTNGASPYFGEIEPLLQIVLGRYNPVLAEWQTRFRGFISDYDYVVDPSQQVNRLVISCVDIFEILNVISMQPDGTFGDPPPTGSEGNVFFDNAIMVDRIAQVMGNAGIDPAFYYSTSGNVDLYEQVYSPGESPLVVITEAVDAEFPGVANVYPDRFGRLVAHGRLAKFDPATISAGAGDEAWDWHHWDCGDGTAVSADPTKAQIRQFAFNRGLSQVVNQASATPKNIADADIAGQIFSDATSIGLYGIRSWSIENLLTKAGNLGGGTTDLEETLKFAQWRVDTHKEPRDRITTLGFRSIRPDAPGAAKTWRIMCESDIADQIDVTVAFPGGGGFADAPFFIEGRHETNEPLNPDFDNVTVTFDVSPQDYNSDPEGRFPTP